MVRMEEFLQSTEDFSGGIKYNMNDYRFGCGMVNLIKDRRGLVGTEEVWILTNLFNEQIHTQAFKIKAYTKV